jgi:hypothetical protein
MLVWFCRPLPGQASSERGLPSRRNLAQNGFQEIAESVPRHDRTDAWFIGSGTDG